MRLSEKNFFLYHDQKALNDIREKIASTMKTIKAEKDDIIRAIGEEDMRKLQSHLKAYSVVIEDAGSKDHHDPDLEAQIRSEGKKLKEYSDSITRLERTRVNDIILNSKQVLIFSFWVILASALIITHIISQRIVRSLRQIEKLTKSISAGNFDRIEGIRPRDELGSVIEAMDSMSEELAHREEQIIQSKKLASLGILTAGVAHEITNPLNNIP
jgi:signal transduction histidine kinase